MGRRLHLHDLQLSLDLVVIGIKLDLAPRRIQLVLGRRQLSLDLFPPFSRLGLHPLPLGFGLVKCSEESSAFGFGIGELGFEAFGPDEQMNAGRDFQLRREKRTRGVESGGRLTFPPPRSRSSRSQSRSSTSHSSSPSPPPSRLPEPGRRRPCPPRRAWPACPGLDVDWR